MSSRINRRVFAVFCLGSIAVLPAAGCGGSSSDSSGSLTLYSSQHEPMTEALIEGFEAENGAEVQVRYGEDEGLASQIEQEGDASPADVVLTENTPPLELLAGKELLAKVDPATLDEVPSRYSSPSGHWVGVAARETAMVYNPDLIAADELPASILDLAKAEWRGKLAIAPSEPDFVPIVSAIEKLDGEAAAKSWLEGFADNAKHYNDNEGIIAAVDGGQIAAGIINHYYWYEAVAEEGKDNVPSKLHYFGNEDPGALVNVSGAGALESSGNAKLAQEFLAYIVSEEGQTAMAESGDWEYPLNPAVSPPPGLKPFDGLEPPKVGPADLGDGSEPVELMQEVGLL
ncbi:MAG: iron(III) transport system substrate-binding protein [Solirubrobacterales bacterium]|nr:iron(III) transport system substrate-binding protein [Solirubrobacterales bacterium]